LLKREPKTAQQLGIPSNDLKMYRDGYDQAMVDWLKDLARSDVHLPPLTTSSTVGWPWPQDVK